VRLIGALGIFQEIFQTGSWLVRAKTQTTRMHSVRSRFQSSRRIESTQQNNGTAPSQDSNTNQILENPTSVDKEAETGKSKGESEDEELESAHSRKHSLFARPLSFRFRKPPSPLRRLSGASTKPKEAPLPSAVAQKSPKGLITIEIGPELKKYYIHADFLKYHSAYFRKSLSGPWLESASRLYTFTDIEAAPFNVLVHWLYTSRIPANTEEWVKISQTRKWKIEVVELKALVLADRFLMPEFMRAVNNDLVTSRMKHAPYYELVIIAFEQLPENCPVLKLFVDTHCLNWEPKASFPSIK